MSEHITESGTDERSGLNIGDDVPPGSEQYPGDGRQDDPPSWQYDGGVIRRDGDVVALCSHPAMAAFIVAVLRRFAGSHEHDDDNPGPGIGGD